MVFLLLRPASENNQERKRRKGKKGEKEGRGSKGGHLTAVELRRDALIAPSGCGQYSGVVRGGEYSARSKVSSLPDVVIDPVSIRRLVIRYSWEFT